MDGFQMYHFLQLLVVVLVFSSVVDPVSALAPQTIKQRLHISGTSTPTHGASRLFLSQSREETKSSNDNENEPATVIGTQPGLFNDDDSQQVQTMQRRNFIVNVAALGLLGVSSAASWSLFQTSLYTPTEFTRLPSTQFIAALGDPKASTGTGAHQWGLWTLDPGPRGVWLRHYQREIVDQNFIAPAGWTYDPANLWLEEHGIIMEPPKFPLPPGRYLVTGGRMVTTGLTVDESGGWKLDEGTLFDVTHLPCRSAKYTPLSSSASPMSARQSDFPVIPGGSMPIVEDYQKQDYAVLFLVGKANKKVNT